VTRRTRVPVAVFDDLYAASDDPWDFTTSRYEHDKYDRTLAALENRHFARALEVGCSVGVLTARLAPRCDELIAVDAARRAVDLARERLSEAPNVEVQQRTFPEELPDGTWDLVVCSEVLYYLDEPTLIDALTVLCARLRPGGSLLAVHWRPATLTHPLRGDETHVLLHRHLPLAPGRHERHVRYVLDRFDKAGDDRRVPHEGGA
jgi:SAM-dependent methyltransferase